MPELKTGSLPKGKGNTIPVTAAQEYISDMLGELCQVAKTSGQDDLLALLNVTRQAVLASKPRKS